MILVALHGFFGAPEDWSPILESFDSKLEIETLTPDLGVWATKAKVTDFETFAAAFNASVRSFVEEREEAAVIAGYSLGARLAAHCLLDSPELYRAGLLISMNPGLSQRDLGARRERLDFDSAWSDRLRREPWENTWKAWNEQTVLRPGSRSGLQTGGRRGAGDLEEIGRRLEGRREAWARAMELWSLGHQADLRADLIEWASELEENRRLTLMTGTDDVKFTELTSAWISGAVPPENVRHRLVLGAGHRILQEAPADVASEISSFL